MVNAALVLAGQREGVVDPLCEVMGVSHKAEIPVSGLVMLERVIQALNDICVGLATEKTIQSEHPETMRTYLRFSDEAVSGCNLFYIANENGLKAIEFWRSVQHLRKNPLKLAKKVGVLIGFKYALGRLSLKAAFDYAAARIGITAAPVLLPFAEAAIDVDKPSDLVLVEDILSQRSS